MSGLRTRVHQIADRVREGADEKEIWGMCEEAGRHYGMKTHAVYAAVGAICARRLVGAEA